MESTGLPTFKEISEMETEIPFCNNEKIGSYRLSFRLLRRITSDKDITSSALVLLLYFIQISDSDNVISDFNYREVTELATQKGNAVLSVKSFYNALKLLKERGYISYPDSAYKTRNIHIIGNEVDKKETFLNLNHKTLIFGTEENDIFLSFPANAKKLFLLMLSRAYSIRKHGSRINLRRLMDDMNVTERSFESYLSQIESLLGTIFRDKNRFTGRKRWIVTIASENRYRYAPKEQLSPGQANYFGRIFDRLLSSYSSAAHPIYINTQEQDLKIWFFALLKKYVSLGPANVFKVFEYVISENAGLTFHSYHDANIILANA